MYGINDLGDGVNKWGVIAQWGSLPVTAYGLLVVSGFLIAVIAAAIKLKKFYKISYDPLLVFAVFAFPLGILFAGVWSYAIGNSRHFYDGFTGQGGLAIQGGVTASTIFGLFFFPFYLRSSKYLVNVPLGKLDEAEKVVRVSTWVYFDAIVPVVLLGQAVGRWGNFFNYEVYGQKIGTINFATAKSLIEQGQTDLLPMRWLYNFMPGVWYNMWIGTVAPTTTSNEAWAQTAHLHQPLFLYESFFNIIIFSVIYFGVNFIPKYKVGVIGGMAITYTGIFRLATEPLRETGFKFNNSIVLSSLFVVIGVLVILGAYFIAGNKYVRKVAWAKYAFDKIKAKLYQHQWFFNLAVNFAKLWDTVFRKTDLKNKIYLEKKQLQERPPIFLDYFLSPNMIKYYGQRHVMVFKKKVWLSA